MKTVVVVATGSEFVAVVGFRCDICATEDQAYVALRQLLNETTNRGECLSVSHELKAEYLDYQEEDEKERHDWSRIPHLALMSDMEKYTVLRASDKELRIAASMARDYRHQCQ